MAKGIDVSISPTERLIEVALTGVLSKAFLWEVMAELGA